MKKIIISMALSFAGCSSAPAQQPDGAAVGMQMLTAPVAGDVPIKLTLWYPTNAAPQTHHMGPYNLDVATGGAVKGAHLPLVVISHGTGGSGFGHFPLASDLAKAGFIVVTFDHTGDNYGDHSRAFGRGNFAGRPTQVHAALDYLLGQWPQHSLIDPARIGMFGHSAGGTTALILGGGQLDWGKVENFCRSHAQDWGCRRAAAARVPVDGRDDVALVTAADPRIKALSIAAPALAHGFMANGLKQVKVPVQLWVAAQDDVVVDAGEVTALLPKKPELHPVNPGGHFGFLPPCGIAIKLVAAEICSDPPGFDRAAFQQTFNAAVVRFFREKLR